MRRRQVLRASAAALGGAGATAGVVALGGDDASAQTALTLSIEGDSATLGPEQGLAAVTLAVDVEWAYELPASANPSTVVVELAAGTDALTVVDSAERSELFTDAEGSESFDLDLLATDALAASAIAPDSGTRETAVTVEARFRVESASGAVLAQETASDTATLEVTREEDPSAAVGGDGSLTIETE